MTELKDTRRQAPPELAAAYAEIFAGLDRLGFEVPLRNLTQSEVTILREDTYIRAERFDWKNESKPLPGMSPEAHKLFLEDWEKMELEAKARWAVRGCDDPDRFELGFRNATQAPTLSMEGRHLIYQLCASYGWDLEIGDQVSERIKYEQLFVVRHDLQRFGPRGRASHEFGVARCVAHSTIPQACRTVAARSGSSPP